LDALAVSHVRTLQKAAQLSVDNALKSEAQRLAALGARNGSVREDEVEAVNQLLTETKDAMARAEPRLQGIRVVVAT
jgi:hypothetical protein